MCRNTSDQRIATEDLIGQSVEIKTTDEQGTERVHFSGLIHDVALQYETWGSYCATLTAISDSYTADITAQKQYYTAGTLQSLAGIIGGRSGLNIAVVTMLKSGIQQESAARKQEIDPGINRPACR